MCPVTVCPLPLSAMCEVHLCYVVTDFPFLSLHGSPLYDRTLPVDLGAVSCFGYYE